jgi:hypothetical protein
MDGVKKANSKLEIRNSKKVESGQKREAEKFAYSDLRCRGEIFLNLGFSILAAGFFEFRV